MSLCQPCIDHIRTRYQTDVPGKILYLVNIPKNILQRMSQDDLLKVKSLASNGIFFCQICLFKCREARNCPSNENFYNAYRFRTMEDKRVIAAIDAEIERRKNILHFQLQMLPDVSKLPPP